MFVLDLSVRKRERDDETQPFAPRTDTDAHLSMQSQWVDATPSTVWITPNIQHAAPALGIAPIAEPQKPIHPLQPTTMPPLLTPLVSREALTMPSPNSLTTTNTITHSIPPLIPNTAEESSTSMIISSETAESDVNDIWKHAGLAREYGGVKKSGVRR